MRISQNHGTEDSSNAETEREGNKKTYSPLRRAMSKHMQITLILLGIAGTVALGTAGILASINHKKAGIVVLFVSLVIYSLTACLYLYDSVSRDDATPKNDQTESNPLVEIGPEYLTKLFDGHAATQAENAKLKEQISVAEQYDVPLDNLAYRILLVLEQHNDVPILEYKILDAIDAPATDINYYLDDLKDLGYIKRTNARPLHGPQYHLTKKGRRYLMENKDEGGW